jgi:hypothetical protein
VGLVLAYNGFRNVLLCPSAIIALPFGLYITFG